MGKLNDKNGAAVVEAKDIGQQMDVAGFTYNSGCLHRFRCYHLLLLHAKQGRLAEINAESSKSGCFKNFITSIYVNYKQYKGTDDHKKI